MDPSNGNFRCVNIKTTVDKIRSMPLAEAYKKFTKAKVDTYLEMAKRRGF